MVKVVQREGGLERERTKRKRYVKENKHKRGGDKEEIGLGRVRGVEERETDLWE